jgi:hypothetical protein
MRHKWGEAVDPDLDKVDGGGASEDAPGGVAMMSVDWGRLRGKRKWKRPELDAGRAIQAADLERSVLSLSLDGSWRKSRWVRAKHEFFST